MLLAQRRPCPCRYGERGLADRAKSMPHGFRVCIGVNGERRRREEIISACAPLSRRARLFQRQTKVDVMPGCVLRRGERYRVADLV